MFKRIKKIRKYAKIASTAISVVKMIESYGDKVQDKESQQEVAENSRILHAKALREKFDKIIIGDLSNEGNGGSSKSEVIELLGEPDMTTNSTIQSTEVEVNTWKSDMVVITVQFELDHAISKNITGFRWGQRPAKLTLESFNDLKIDSSYSAVVELIGAPDGYSESKINGNSYVTANWRTGLAGKRGANAILMFRNGHLTNKSQAHLS